MQAILKTFLALFLISGFAQAQEGTVRRVEGSVLLNSKTQVTVGTPIKPKDIIEAKEGTAQIQMQDNSWLEVRKNSKVVLEEYQYQGKNDGTEKSGWKLLKGMLRTVTGYIGKANGTNHKVYTANATIGVRGSTGIVGIDPQRNTWLQVEDGKLIIKNAGGELVVSKGETAVAGATGTPVFQPALPADLGHHFAPVIQNAPVGQMTVPSESAYDKLHDATKIRQQGEQQYRDVTKSLGQ